MIESDKSYIGNYKYKTLEPFSVDARVLHFVFNFS